MPIHDWTRVTAGTFHDFHLAWLAELRTALNDGLLPPDYYAQAEQVAGPMGPDVLTLQVPEASRCRTLPDVLTLQVPEASGNGSAGELAGGGLAVATIPPRVRWTAAADMLD